MADWNNPATWAQAYKIRGGFPEKPGFGRNDLSYLEGRSFALQLGNDEQGGLAHFRYTLQRLSNGGLNPAAETLIVGCGFGWLLEVIVDAGSNAAWGTDLSTAIQSLLDDPGVDVRADIQALILNIDIQAADVKDQFIAAGAGTNRGEFRNIVTEHVLEDWPIGDMTTILDACDNLRAPGQSSVYHLVSAIDRMDLSGVDSEILVNLFTLSEWVALRPEHIWVDALTGNIGGGA